MRRLALAALLCLCLPVLAQDIKKEYPSDPVAVIKTSMGDIYVELFAKEAPKTVKNFIDLAEGKKTWTDPKTGKKVKTPFYDGLVCHRVIKNFMIQGGCPLGTGTGGPGYRFEDEISAKGLGLDKAKVLGANDRPHPSMGPRIPRAALTSVFKELGIRSQKDLDARRAEVGKRLKAMSVKKALELQGYRYSDKLKSHVPLRGVLAMANSGPNTNGSQFFINLIDTPWLAGKHTVFGKVVKGMDVVDRIAQVEVGRGAKPTKDVRILSVRLLKPKK